MSDYGSVENDIFAYSVGTQAYIRPSPILDFNRDTKKGITDIPETGTDPVFTKVFSDFDLSNINEYGFNIWIRYLTMYPIPMKR